MSVDSAARSEPVTTPSRPAGEELVFVSNALETPIDEGIRKCAHELARRYRQDGHIAYAIRADGPWMARKLLLDRGLARAVRRTRPRSILYLPSQSATAGTLARAALLRMTTGTPVILLSLQPTSLERVRLLPRRLRPRSVLSPSPSVVAAARSLGLRASFVPMGVDVTRFHPVDPAEKAALRTRHGLGEGPVVLHVGHARHGRNLDWLVEVRPRTGATAVAVFGASRGRDEALIARLRAGGVHVIDTYVERIEELYQLSDCYVFTVEDEGSAIGVPLSVLEAMACNIPVATTRFGGLTEMFDAGGGLDFIEHDDPLDTLQALVGMRPESVSTRALVAELSWDSVADTIAAEVAAGA